MTPTFKLTALNYLAETAYHTMTLIKRLSLEQDGHAEAVRISQPVARLDPSILPGLAPALTEDQS